MKNQDSIGIIFVNSVAARGLFNNVANLSFSAYNFTPNEEGTVDPDPAIVCRLRMDKGCLMQLHQVTADLLQLLDAPEPEIEQPKEAEEVEVNGVAPRPVKSKSKETSH